MARLFSLKVEVWTGSASAGCRPDRKRHLTSALPLMATSPPLRALASITMSRVQMVMMRRQEAPGAKHPCLNFIQYEQRSETLTPGLAPIPDRPPGGSTNSRLRLHGFDDKGRHGSRFELEFERSQIAKGNRLSAR